MADVIEIDAATGEVTERDFTPDELAQREADAAAFAAAEAERLAAEKQAAADRAALLDKLGITEAEAKTLASFVAG